MKLDYQIFLDKVFVKLNKLGVDVSGLELDHLGYKVATNEEYDQTKAEFLKLGDCVGEPILNDRRIGHFKLFIPLEYGEYHIPALELIAPMQSEQCATGFEHAEFVLKESYQSFMAKHPKLNWDLSAVNRSEFSMIKLRLDENTQVKFHLKPILNT